MKILGVGTHYSEVSYPEHIFNAWFGLWLCLLA